MLSFDFYQLNTICRVHTPEVRIVVGARWASIIIELISGVTSRKAGLPNDTPR